MPQPRPRQIITPVTIKLARDRPARSLELEKDVEGDRDQDEDERQDQRLILGPAEMLPPPIENTDIHGGLPRDARLGRLFRARKFPTPHSC